jgi:hypothetical protein
MAIVLFIVMVSGLEMLKSSSCYGSPEWGSFDQFALVNCQSQAEKFRKIVRVEGSPKSTFYTPSLILFTKSPLSDI